MKVDKVESFLSIFILYVNPSFSVSLLDCFLVKLPFLNTGAHGVPLINLFPTTIFDGSLKINVLPLIP